MTCLIIWVYNGIKQCLDKDLKLKVKKSSIWKLLVQHNYFQSAQDIILNNVYQTI